MVTTVESPEIAARWSNNVQALVEGAGLGIPANNSSDPRHNAVANTEYNEGSGYKLTVPIGQSSVIVFEGINFATEPDMMKAAEMFNIDAIKKELGEQ